MARPLRLFEPDGIYFVTGRCLQARLLMVPTEMANHIIAGVLAKGIKRFDVEVFAFVFLSNHFHILVRSQSCQIPAFMQFVRANIAKKLGDLVDWHGKFWDRRYDGEPVLDDDALVGRLRYILAHGVKENLVDRVLDWPGLTSIPELMGRGDREFAWPGGSADDSVLPKNPLKLTPLPCWEGDSVEERKMKILAIISDVETKAGEERRVAGVGVLGVTAILAQHPHSKPSDIKRSPRPLCHASTKEARDAYAAKYREFAEHYAEASLAYRSGFLTVEFPLYSHRPPWVVPWRLAA